MKGIEPSSVAWEATALPLSYTRAYAEVYSHGDCLRNWSARRRRSRIIACAQERLRSYR